MPTVTIDLSKSIEENAGVYFNSAKKLKKKIEGAQTALSKTEKKLRKLEQDESSFQEQAQAQAEKKQRNREWYEKFRWFFTSDGLLAIGGRDATTNEILIKKHTEPTDLVFHTDISGSPFFILKVEDTQPSKDALKELSHATATFSAAWKTGLSSTPVFYVKPEQVTKSAPSGEFLKKGSFMISGKTTYVENSVDLAVGITSAGAVMAGPLAAITKNTEQHVVVVQGKDKTSDVAKKINKKFDNAADLDELIRSLPAGGCSLKK